MKKIILALLLIAPIISSSQYYFQGKAGYATPEAISYNIGVGREIGPAIVEVAYGTLHNEDGWQENYRVMGGIKILPWVKITGGLNHWYKTGGVSPAAEATIFFGITDGVRMRISAGRVFGYRVHNDFSTGFDIELRDIFGKRTQTQRFF